MKTRTTRKNAPDHNVREAEARACRSGQNQKRPFRHRTTIETYKNSRTSGGGSTFKPAKDHLWEKDGR